MVSSSILAIAVVIILSPYLIAYLYPLFNGFIENYNSLSEDGKVKEKSHDLFTSNVKLIKFLPVITLVGLFLWGIVVAQEGRK